MRLAIVGAGGMGSFHARSLAALPGVEIVAVADTYIAAAESLSAAVGGAATADGMAVASMADLDGLVIASPEDTHEQFVHAALAEGTGILCEKPLAVGAAACRRIVDAEVGLGHRLLQLGLMPRLRPGTRATGSRGCDVGRAPSHPLCAPQRS